MIQFRSLKKIYQNNQLYKQGYARTVTADEGNTIIDIYRLIRRKTSIQCDFEHC